MSWNLERFADSATTTLLAGITSGDTIIQVSNPIPFPAKPFKIILDQERMLVTNTAGSMFTVSRAIEGTAAANHSFGAPLTQIVSKAGLFNLFENSGINQCSIALATSSSITLAPVLGDRVALYDSYDNHWRICQVASSLTISVPNAASTNYDVFAYITPSFIVGLQLQSWASDTARSVALATQDGTYVQSGTPTLRYLGTIRTDGSGNVVDSASQRFIWNVNNKKKRPVAVPSGITTTAFTSSASYSFVGTFFEFVCGLSGSSVVALDGQLLVIGGAGTGTFQLGYMLNRASAIGLTGFDSTFTALSIPSVVNWLTAKHVDLAPTIGYNTVRLSYLSGFSGTINGTNTGISGFIDL